MTKEEKVEIIKFKIIKKLDLEYQFIESESVYFLNLLYKLIENQKDKYPAITLFRNWSSHSELSNRQYIINKVTDDTVFWIKETQKKNGLKNDEFIDDVFDKYYFWNSVTARIFSFIELKREVEEQAISLKADFKFDQKDGWWIFFLRGLLFSIEEVPLIIDKNNCPIKRITVKATGPFKNKRTNQFLQSYDNGDISYVTKTIYEDGYEDCYCMTLFSSSS